MKRKIFLFVLFVLVSNVFAVQELKDISITNEVYTASEVDEHKWNFETSITNVPNFALDTNVVHASYNEDYGYIMPFLQLLNMYGLQISLEPTDTENYIEINGEDLILSINNHGYQTDYRCDGIDWRKYREPQMFIDFPYATEKYFAVTSNSNGIPDNIPTNIVLFNEFNNYITNAIGFGTGNYMTACFDKYESRLNAKDAVYFFDDKLIFDGYGVISWNFGKEKNYKYTEIDFNKLSLMYESDYISNSILHRIKYQFPTNVVNGDYNLVIANGNMLENITGIDTIIPFNYHTNYYRISFPTLNKYSYDSGDQLYLLDDKGYQEIYPYWINDNDSSPAGIKIFTSPTDWERINILTDGNIPGIQIINENFNEVSPAEIAYGILGISFAYFDDNEYIYFFPTNKTTKYFALTDNADGSIDCNINIPTNLVRGTLWTVDNTWFLGEDTEDGSIDYNLMLGGDGENSIFLAPGEVNIQSDMHAITITGTNIVNDVYNYTFPTNSGEFLLKEQLTDLVHGIIVNAVTNGFDFNGIHYKLITE